MANQQTFKLHGVTINGRAIGGVVSCGVDIQAVEGVGPAHGEFGPSHNEAVFHRINVALATQDPNDVKALMAAAAGQIIGHLLQASDVTENQKYTMGGTGGFVIDQMSMRFALTEPATLDVSGPLKFGAGEDIDAMLVSSATATTPVPESGVTNTVPDRYLKPNTVAFAGVTIQHVQEITFSATARLAEDMADTNSGPEAIDVIEWGQPRVSINFKHSRETTTEVIDMQQKIIKIGEGTLTAVLLGMGAATNDTLTINNLRFRQGRKNFGEDYSTFTLDGVIPIISDDGLTFYDWNTTPDVGPPIVDNFVKIA